MEGGDLEALIASTELFNGDGMCSTRFCDALGDPCKTANVRWVLAHHRELSGTIDKLLTRANNGSIEDESILDDLTIAKSHLDGIDQYLKDFIQPRHYAEYRPPHASTIAQQVFDIPEILEMVLEYLCMKDLLQIQLVNKQFQAAVDGSDRLQRRLFFRAHPSSRRILTFGWEMNGFNCDEVLPPFQIPNNVHISLPGFDHVAISASFGANMPTRIGDRCRGMLVCQPIVRQMNVYTDCCLVRPPGGRRNRRNNSVFPPLVQTEHCVVNNENGLTVGDLYDMAKKLANEHQYCHRAEASAHDPKTGKVRVRVIFQTSIELHPEDPLCKVRTDRLEWEAKSMLAHSEHRMQKNRMSAFVAAKLAAYAAGKPIPTLEEFDATNV